MGGVAGALAWVVRGTFCMDLFLFAAERTRFGTTRTARAVDLRDAHPWWYGICFYVDLGLRVIAALALVAVVLSVAYKTVAPLPLLK